MFMSGLICLGGARWAVGGGTCSRWVAWARMVQCSTVNAPYKTGVDAAIDGSAERGSCLVRRRPRAHRIKQFKIGPLLELVRGSARLPTSITSLRIE